MIHAPATLRSLVIAPGGDEGPWRITRETGPDPARALVGRTPEEAARLAPLVFNLCGAAHAAAASAALGLPHAPDARATDRETARDHALALLHAVPLALGMASDRAALALLSRPGSETACAAALAGAGDDMSGFSLSDLEGWLAEAPTPTARLFARLRRVDPAHGRARLPELTAQALAQTLRPAPTPAEPACSGAPPPASPADGATPARCGGATADGAAAPSALCETGALGRVAHRPLFAALLAQEGASLFVRLLARLADCLTALSAPASGRDDTARGLTAPAGVGIAPAARGLLGHGARVEGGRIAAYRILAPSAWNLAPKGLLEQAFASLPPGPQAVRLAPLLVSAINPCVPVTLALAPEAAHA